MMSIFGSIPCQGIRTKDCCWADPEVVYQLMKLDVQSLYSIQTDQLISDSLFWGFLVTY